MRKWWLGVLLGCGTLGEMIGAYSLPSTNVLRLRGGVVRYPELLGEDNLQKRRAACAAAIRLDPGNAEAWLALGEVRALQGEWDEVQRVHEEGAHKCSSDLRLRQLSCDGDIYYNPDVDKDWMKMKGFDEDAITSFEADFATSDPKGRTSAKIIHATNTPVVPADSCSWIVREANYYVEGHGYDPHPDDAFAPSKHVHVSLVAAIVPWFNEWVKATGIPFVRQCYSLSQEECASLRVQQALVIRYDADGPGTKGLKRHVDPNEIVITVALNSEEEDFKGGGLWVDALESTIAGPIGTMVAIDGRLSHAELAVEEGTRYVLAVYMSVGGNRSGKPSGYTLESLSGPVVENMLRQSEAANAEKQ